jgi:ADP-ribosyl-[dinitrogen reductase] hydrolase
MIGAIAGDMIGSPYEGYPIKHKDFHILVSGYTDDTILTVAIADWIINKSDLTKTIVTYAEKEPHAKYGRSFKKWIWSWEPKPYYSCGNGSAMRVSPVGFAFNSIDDVLKNAQKSAEVTHNHPEGIKGAQSVALAIYLARIGESKENIRSEIGKRFEYNLNRTIEDIRPSYKPDASCQGSVPESIIAFLDSDSYVDAIKKAISLGGDADTMACIAGGIAQAFYKKIPETIISDVRAKLPLKYKKVIDHFNSEFNCEY